MLGMLGLVVVLLGLGLLLGEEDSVVTVEAAEMFWSGGGGAFGGGLVEGEGAPLTIWSSWVSDMAFGIT